MIKDGIENFFNQSWLSFKALYSWIEPKTYFFVKILNPIFQLIFFCLLAKYSFKTNNLTSWVIGNSFLLCIYNSIFGIGAVFMVERYYGTLKIIVASPANKFSTFFQRGFVHIIDSMVTVFIGLTIGALLFNISFRNINLGLFFIITIIAMFSAAGLGLFIGSLGLVTSEINLIMNIFAMLLMAFSGANFPVESLPLMIQKFSYCLPITRSIKAANLLMQGRAPSTIKYLMLEEILVGIIYILLGYFFMRFTERIAKQRATLDLY